MALVGDAKNSEKALVGDAKNSEKALVGDAKNSEKALVGGDEDLSMRDLQLTEEELELLQQAAIDLAFVKMKEVAHLASAAACFKAAKESSSIPEPQPSDVGVRRLLPLRVVFRGLFKATPSQMRAAQKTVRRVLKIDPKDVESVSADVYTQVLRTTVEGEKEVPLRDVTRVLEAFSKMENNLPKGSKVELPKEKSKVEMMKAYADNINRVAGVCGAAKSTYEVLRDFFF